MQAADLTYVTIKLLHRNINTYMWREYLCRALHQNNSVHTCNRSQIHQDYGQAVSLPCAVVNSLGSPGAPSRALGLYVSVRTRHLTHTHLCARTHAIVYKSSGSMDRPYRCPARLQAAWVAPGLPPAHWACMLLFTLGTRTDFTRTHTHTHEILMQSPVTLPIRKPNLFLMPPS